MPNTADWFGRWRPVANQSNDYLIDREAQRTISYTGIAGVFPQDQLARYYAAADVFVFPSRTDTFGLVLLEALACGTPVAAYPVTGPIDVKLWASSSALDTDFTAKLIDVHPPTADFPAGIDMNIEDGIIRARFRNSIEKAELMKPGEVYEFTIHMYPTSNLFKAGHRIRIDISSSNFPRFDVNPNTGEPLNGNRRMMIATNTIYHDAAHPSHVILPIVK